MMPITIYDCKTIDDICKLLDDKLIPVYGLIGENINEQIWVLKWHFKQSFLNNNVYFHKLTNTYAFHIIDEEDYKYGHNLIYSDFPNMGYYSTYSEMLNGVSNKFYELWNLGDTSDLYGNKLTKQKAKK